MKSATTQRLDSCPKCGNALEATVRVYLSEVVIEPVDGKLVIVSSVDSSKAIGCEVDYYCANECGEVDGAIQAMAEKHKTGWPGTIELDGGVYSS